MGPAHAPPSSHEPRDFRSRPRRALGRSRRRLNLRLALRGSQMNLFRRPSVRYGQTPAPETPYQRAAQVWDDRIGSARVQARNWRLIAFGNLVLAAGLAAGLVWQSAQGTVVPWVDLNDPRHHGALCRLPDEPRSKARRQDQIAEGDEAPVSGLHASGADAVVPYLSRPLIGRLGRGCLAVADGRTPKEIHL